MTDDMVEILEGIYLVHTNFALRTSLFFYRGTLFHRDYHIKTFSLLRKLEKEIEKPDYRFLLNSMSLDIKMFDERCLEEKGYSREKTMKVSDKKKITKMAISYEDEKY
jgi:hypothetical protein